MNQLATVPAGGAMAQTVAEVQSQAHLIQQVLRAVMKEGTHYGKVPGTDNPTLLKAGAEKILATFKIAIEPVVTDLSTPDCIRYRVTARGIHMGTGNFVGAGIGECSTDEEKYRWRAAVCTKEWEQTPEDRRRVKYLRGWQGKPAREIQQVRTNPLDLANTVLKMSKKRAMVDLAITATAASDIFVQDIEDLEESLREHLVDTETGEILPPQGSSAKPAVDAPREKKAPAKGSAEPIKPGQVAVLKKTAERAGVELAKVEARYGTLEQIPAASINEVLAWVRGGAA